MGGWFLSSTGLGSGTVIGGREFLSAPSLDKIISLSFSKGGFLQSQALLPRKTNNTPKYWAWQYIWHSERHSQERRAFLQKAPSKNPLFLVPELGIFTVLSLTAPFHWEKVPDLLSPLCRPIKNTYKETPERVWDTISQKLSWKWETPRFTLRIFQGKKLALKVIFIVSLFLRLILTLKITLKPDISL